MLEPAKYLVVIDAAGEMLALMFDADHRLIADFDASSSEVAVMTQGLTPRRGALQPVWDAVLGGHSRIEREQAQIYTLDV
jgi:hypothetical protein